MSSLSPSGVPLDAPQSFPISLSAARWSLSVRIGRISIMDLIQNWAIVRASMASYSACVPMNLTNAICRRKSNDQPVVSASDLEAGALTIEYLGLRGGSANVVHRGPVRGCYQPIPTLKRNCRLGMRPGICQQNVSRNQTHWTLVAAFPCWEQ